MVSSLYTGLRGDHRTLLQVESARITGDSTLLDQTLAMAGIDETTAVTRLTAIKAQAWQDFCRDAASFTSLSLIEKIDALSCRYLGAPYHLVIDRLTPWHCPDIAHDFAFRLDAFDCMTFVETVLALSQYSSVSAETVPTLVSLLQPWMFAAGPPPSIFSRHRFVDAEWLPAASSRVPALEDITPSLPFPIATQTRILDKGGLLRRQLQTLRPESQMAPYFTEAFFREALAQADATPVMHATVPYVPILEVIQHTDALLRHLQSLPPAAYIATVISDAPHLRDSIGSDYNVTHLGFLFVRETGLLFRHATSVGLRQVVEVDLKTYAENRLAMIAARGVGEQGGQIVGFGVVKVSATSERPTDL